MFKGKPHKGNFWVLCIGWAVFTCTHSTVEVKTVKVRHGYYSLGFTFFIMCSVRL